MITKRRDEDDNYRSGWISWRSQRKIIHAPPITLQVEVVSLRTLLHIDKNIAVICMEKEKCSIVMQINLCKLEDGINILLRSNIPRWNDCTRYRNPGHWQVLWDVCNEEINPSVLAFVIRYTTGPPCSNLKKKIWIRKYIVTSMTQLKKEVKKM